MRWLTTDDVIGLMTYPDEKTTDQLYGLGSMLLAECIDRAKQLDTRAMALVGYCGVTTALLISTFATRLQGMSMLAAAFIIAAGICLFIATILAFSALWIREYEWFSDTDWFSETVLGRPDRLKQTHLVAMHQYRAKHEHVNSRKSSLLLKAYLVLMICGGMLASGLIVSRL